MIEPNAAHYWAGVANEILFRGGSLATVPTEDKRNWSSSIYRVDPKGVVAESGEIQVINLRGPMAKYSFCGSLGWQFLQQAIRAANLDSSVAALVLHADCPGGQVDGTDNAAREFKSFSKPKITLVDGMLCSAGLWVGSGADEIIVDPANDGHNATIGSIGTMAMWRDYSKQEKKQGIKTHIVLADASSDKTKFFDKANAGDYTELKAQLNALNDTFLAAIKTNRAGKLSDTEDVLTGKTYNAKDAIKYGLADRMGNFQMAVSRAYFLAKNNFKK